MNENNEKPASLAVKRIEAADVNSALLQTLGDIDAKAFQRAQVELDEEAGHAVLTHPGAIHLLLKAGETIIGYITALPHDESYSIDHGNDPLMVKGSDSLYVESIAILPEKASLKGILQLMNTIILEADKSGYQIITMHARVGNGLSSVVQKKYKAKFIRRVDNYYELGEPFDFLELDTATALKK
jgi:hypothetical protein